MIILFSQPGRNWELHLPMMKACSSPIIPGLKLPYLLNSTPVSWTVSTLYTFLTDASWCISAWRPKLLCHNLITGGLQVDSIIVYIKRSVQQTAVSCAEVGASLVTRTGPWLTGSGFFPHLFWDRSHQWTPYGDRYFGCSFVVCPGSPIGWSRLTLAFTCCTARQQWAVWYMLAVCETVKMRHLLASQWTLASSGIRSVLVQNRPSCHCGLTCFPVNIFGCCVLSSWKALCSARDVMEKIDQSAIVYSVKMSGF